MPVVELDFSSYEYLWALLAPVLYGLYRYIKSKGFKIASAEKVSEYRDLKEVAVVLSNNISKEEFLEIVSAVVEMKKSKKTITVEDVAMIGNMLVDAVTTEEKK